MPLRRRLAPGPGKDLVASHLSRTRHWVGKTGSGTSQLNGQALQAALCHLLLRELPEV